MDGFWSFQALGSWNCFGSHSDDSALCAWPKCFMKIISEREEDPAPAHILKINNFYSGVNIGRFTTQLSRSFPFSLTWVMRVSGSTWHGRRIERWTWSSGFESQLCHFLAMWASGSHSTLTEPVSLSIRLSSLISLVYVRIECKNGRQSTLCQTKKE